MTHTAAETIRQWGGPVSEPSNTTTRSNTAKDMLDGAWDTGDGTTPTDSGIPTDDQLREQRKELAFTRECAAEAEAAYQERYAHFVSIAAFELEQRSHWKALVEQEETKLRLLALARYSGTQEKRPIPGVEVRLVKKLADTEHADAYEHGYDLSCARDWALRENRSDLIKLDRMAFESKARALISAGDGFRSGLEWLELVEVPEARIATDLAAITD